MSHNDITGDKIATKPASDKFRENYDAIFKKEPVDADTCGKCGQPWSEHEFGVPAPYCPGS